MNKLIFIVISLFLGISSLDAQDSSRTFVFFKIHNYQNAQSIFPENLTIHRNGLGLSGGVDYLLLPKAGIGLSGMATVQRSIVPTVRNQYIESFPFTGFTNLPSSSSLTVYGVALGAAGHFALAKNISFCPRFMYGLSRSLLTGKDRVYTEEITISTFEEESGGLLMMSLDLLVSLKPNLKLTIGGGYTQSVFNFKDQYDRTKSENIIIANLDVNVGVIIGL